MKIVNNIIYITLLGVIASCSAPKQLVLPAELVVPAAFDSNASYAVTAPLQLDAFYQDPHLQHLLKTALQNNFDIKIAMQRLAMANAEWKMAKGLWLPSLQFGGGASGNKYGKYTMEGVGNFDTNLSPNISDDQRVKTNPVPNYLLNLGVNWEVDLWGKYKHMRKAAQANFLASEEGKKMVLANVATEVAKNYYLLIALDEELIIFEENISLLNKSVEVIKIQKEVGRATELGVQQFEAQLLNSMAAKEIILQKINAVEHQLKILIGTYDAAILRATKIDFKQIANLSNLITPQSVLQNRPDVQYAFQVLNSAKANAMAVRAAFYPSLNVGANVGFNAFAGKMLFNPGSLAWNVLGGLTAPIWQKNQLKSQFNIATAQQLAAFYDFEKTAIAAYNEVGTLVYQIASYEKVHALKTREVASLESAIEASNDLYVAGYANYLELIAAQKSKLDANIQRVEILNEQAKCMIMLYKAIGGAWQ